MDLQHPFSRSISPRPVPYRQRSNSFPIVDALGCSTPEAELILAEGRAAVRSRHSSARRRGRSRREIETFRPQDHISYLAPSPTQSGVTVDALAATARLRAPRHARIPSDATDRSTSTIVAPHQSAAEDSRIDNALAASPLGDYSAHLAKFIQSQLNSIPTYRPDHCISPRSCPDLSFPSRTSSQSSVKPARRHVDAPRVIEIPAIRPPLKSTFSAWSSTDDETDEDIPPPPNHEMTREAPKPDTYTPSLLCYYEQPREESFLFPSSPPDESEYQDSAKSFTYASRPNFLPSSTEVAILALGQDGNSSRARSRASQFSSSSAPSLSSTSTGSYFDYKLPISRAPGSKNAPLGKVITAISPFEGGALANVHDIIVQSQQKIVVDGMFFDMVRDFAMPDEGIRTVPTPC